MSIIVVGLSHRTADIEMRERLAFPGEKLAEGLKELLSIEDIREGIILSTCNRVEVYCVISDPADGERRIKTFLSAFHNVPLEKLELILYTYKKEDAIRHVFRVASSLDSMVLGEPQILGQIKDAYSKSLVLNTTGVILNRLIKKAISVAKKVRTETRIGENAVSISYVAVELAKKIFEDIHARTAVEIFGLSPSDITPEMRRRAKAVNFGIVYGISPYGLASDIGISQNEAKEYIDNYFLRHKGVKSFIEYTIVKAKENGYVTTLLNRRRYVPELASEDNSIRQFGERIAINTPVQGSAADIIKLAMINIQRRLIREGLKAKMILQVHDELLFEVPEEELQVTKDLVIEEMEGVMSLAVPLKVDTGTGKNWREAG